MRHRAGFTLVEMLVVMAIIAVLAGLVLMGSGFAQRKAAASRAEAEIKAMEAALESYKADNGIYPRTTATDGLNPTVTTDPASYKTACLDLYKALAGDSDANRATDASAKRYMEFKPDMLAPSGGTGAVTYISDPFGNSYGYSTVQAAENEKATPANPLPGNNPTFDLWTTGGAKGALVQDKGKWIKNW